MAGAGFKTFTAGAVLGATEVNTYLMQQSLMVFSTLAAGTAVIGTPTEGMHIYDNSTGVISAYDGTYWQPITPASRESGNTNSVTLTSGSPWSTATGLVTFTANRFAVGVTPVVSAVAQVTSSFPCVVQIYSVSNTGFSYRVSLYAASTATVPIHWTAVTP
jgi:hypothetical protein